MCLCIVFLKRERTSLENMLLYNLYVHFCLNASISEVRTKFDKGSDTFAYCYRAWLLILLVITVIFVFGLGRTQCPYLPKRSESSESSDHNMVHDSSAVLDVVPSEGLVLRFTYWNLIIMILCSMHIVGKYTNGFRTF